MGKIIVPSIVSLFLRKTLSSFCKNKKNKDKHLTLKRTFQNIPLKIKC